MSSRSAQAQKLFRRLYARTELWPLEVRWDNSGRPGWRYHVAWDDGPTVATMRAMVLEETVDLPDLDPAGFGWLRGYHTHHHVALLIRHYLDHPDEPRHQYASDFAQELYDVCDWPERTITAADQHRARAVLNLCEGLSHRAMTVLQERGADWIDAALQQAESNVRDIRTAPTTKGRTT